MFKERLLDYIKSNYADNGVTFVEVKRFAKKEGVPVHGDRSLFNGNTIYWEKISKEIADVITDLLDEGKICFKPTDSLVYFSDGEALHYLPIAKLGEEYNEDHWLPVMIIDRRDCR